jgi:predicted XRE-type DNA-binding protein
LSQDWVEQVKELTRAIEQNAEDSKRKAELKQQILREKAKTMKKAEIGRLIGVTRERVSAIVKEKKPTA